MAESEDLGVGRLRSLWLIIVSAFRADPWRAAAALAFSVLNGVSNQVSVYLTSRVIGAVVAGDESRAIELAVWLGAFSGIGISAALVRIDLRWRMEEATAMLIDEDIIKLAAGIPGLEYHERPEHIDRLDLVRNHRRSLGGAIGAVVESLSTVAGMTATAVLLFTVDPWLVLLPFFAVPSLAASALTRTWSQKLEARTTERKRQSQHLYVLGTTGAPAKELRVFGLRDEIRRRFADLTEEIDREHDRLAWRSTLVTTGGWLVFAGAYAAAIVLTVRAAVTGDVGVAEVVLVVTLAEQVNRQVGGVFWMIGWLFDTLKTAARFLRLKDDALAARRDPASPVPPPARLVDGIELVDVGFTYPGTAAEVLHDVNLRLPAGSTVAIVGDNGAGKSTLVKLLCGFYDPTSGAVLVDGTDLTRIPVESWRERMSAGFQDFARLELVARETVGVGSLPDIEDEAAVASALDRASAADVVMAMSSGLATQLGRTFDGGSELSGGQWQKLALGRAMMREDPLLLVLDEPTAALDADTEHALFERYAGAARDVAAGTGGITVLVSHRFSTVRMADLIVVVGGGTVTECGTHEELMTQGGVYAELYELQARAYR